ncbi:leucine--tRNA ligase [Candidatus Poribacteria bacterium]|nr:leucine--tRNA ligase [Candidatus Poribacteria bacterium]
MRKYDFAGIESKWQKIWSEKGFYRKPDNANESEKFYALDMFAYTSGSMHMGHARTYTMGDVVARYKKRQGYKLLHPMGWDAFGLPADMAAVKHNVDPAEWTEQNMAKWRGQFTRLGMPFDWSEEIVTCYPEYYRWTQWLFLKFFERDLVYRKYAYGNWCPSCNTVLANEQVIAGKCERCDSTVEQKPLDQWFFKITDYADRLLEGLDRLEGWPEKVKIMQRNWIGKSEGTKLLFPVKDKTIEVFTTRPDTVYGATYLILSPEHPMLKELVRGTEYEDKVINFAQKMIQTDRIERESEEAEKEGIFTGTYAINPFTGEDIPVWIANYVLMDYGTGAIMAVPAHDQRDFEFARKYDLPIRLVIQPQYSSLDENLMKEAYAEEGVMTNSGQFNDLNSTDALDAIIKYAESKGIGERAVSYRLRDWCVSRQRYWGTPIPIIHCEKCGMIPASRLPVELPPDVEITGMGPSPLALVDDFVNVDCPECGGKARRDTDTLDTFVCSSWYFLRFASPKHTTSPFDEKAVKTWLPVDQYFGGVEHAILHLLYARFFTKVLYDMNMIDFDEPFANLFTPGMVTKDGQKMSKSKGNVVEVDEAIKQYGADTLRLFVLFAGPPERDLEWDDGGIEGMNRFLKRLWRMAFDMVDNEVIQTDSDALKRQIHRTIKKVTEDIDRIHYNTAISSIIELMNSVYTHDKIDNAALEAVETIILLLSPFAPYITEELWQVIGHNDSVHEQPWSDYDPEMTTEKVITVVIQVNGKVRDRIKVPAGTSEEELKRLAQKSDRVRRWIDDKKIQRIIVIPDKLVNVVVDNQ